MTAESISGSISTKEYSRRGSNPQPDQQLDPHQTEPERPVLVKAMSSTLENAPLDMHPTKTLISLLIEALDLWLSTKCPNKASSNCPDVQGLVVQSVVSLTSSLRVILLTVSADSIYKILIFFAEKM